MPQTVVQPRESFQPLHRGHIGRDAHQDKQSFSELLAGRIEARAEASEPQQPLEPDQSHQPTASAPDDLTPDTEPQGQADDSPSVEPVDAGEVEADQESTADTSSGVAQHPEPIAAAIVAELQPLTIRSLNTRLLHLGQRAEPGVRTLPSTASSINQSTSPDTSVVPGSTMTHTGGRTNALEERPPPPPVRQASPEIAFAAADQSPAPAQSETVPPGGPERTLPSSPSPAAQSAAHSTPPAAASAVGTGEAAQSVAASQIRSPDAAAVRSPVSPGVAAVPVANHQGRNPGGGAHLPRPDAHNPAATAARRGADARTEALVTAQAARGLAAAMSRQDGAVTLRLNPESLGFLRIRLELGKGQVLARFEASTEQARGLLERSSETLRASLEAKGWEASQVRVELLREADPAAGMLKRLEQFAGPAMERQAAQEASVGQEQGRGAGGGDRGQSDSRPDSSPRPRDDEHGAAGDPVGHADAPASVIGLWSRLDTIV